MLHPLRMPTSLRFLTPLNNPPHRRLSLPSSQLAEHCTSEKGLKNIRHRSRCMVTCYPPGARYTKHVDNGGEVGNGRRITALLYLNEEWLKGDGGELSVYKVRSVGAAQLIICGLLRSAPHSTPFLTSLTHPLLFCHSLRSMQEGREGHGDIRRAQVRQGRAVLE